MKLTTSHLNVGINDNKVVITIIAIVFLGILSSDVFTAFISLEFGMFVNKDFSSSDTRYELSGTDSTAFILLMKSVVS